MGIFSSIKNAIFGRKAKPAPTQPQAQPQGQPQQPQAMPQMNQPQPAAAVDVDQVTALAEDRERLWGAVSGADFLGAEEKPGPVRASCHTKRGR